RPSLFVHRFGSPLHLRSFPTRRSSDLSAWLINQILLAKADDCVWFSDENILHSIPTLAALDKKPLLISNRWDVAQQAQTCNFPRSEEHTSELQSRENLVCRLLLEKKKH